EDLVFRQVITLRDGARVLLRPLVPEDRQALLDFFLPVSFQERRYMRHNVNDADVVASWAENIDYDKTFPLVAVIGERIVGNATLHFNEGPARHRAEVRIFLSKDFKRRGLGNKLIQALVDLARRRSLYMLEVQIVSDQVEVIKAMHKAGFETVCTFEDYFILPDGELRDIAHLVLRLRTIEDEF
ncbi:MAG: GNAT family N-acetyltransferase, partial [Chloroflexi bacterium]|nr:GNAT family N-acetyltransferase [Chloroflexota bacterium]